MENFEYYIGLIILLVIGVIVIKKVTSCLFRIIVGLLMLAALAWGAHQMGIY